MSVQLWGSASFWAKVDVRGPDECWPWKRSCTPRGYGKVSATEYAHRRAYEIAVGPIPPGMEVLHSCDCPPCCNPRHLRAGSHAENMIEASERRRFRPADTRAHRSANARLTWDAVDDLKRRHADGESMRSIARSLGVCHRTVADAIHGRKWKAEARA